MIVLKGFDGVQREIQNTFEKLEQTPSVVLTIYFYYMQVQQLIFRGKWKTLNQMQNQDTVVSAKLDLNQRQEYFNKVSSLLKIWRWNGLDFPLFLIAILGLLSMPGQSLNLLAVAITLQFFFTYLTHIYLSRNL